MITVEAASDPSVIIDGGGRYALMSIPYAAGAPCAVHATVIAADNTGRMKRWRCEHFGALDGAPSIEVTDGNAPWACVVTLRDGAMILDVEGETGVQTRWWLDGYVRIYA
jgi:hypothetical protein